MRRAISIIVIMVSVMTLGAEIVTVNDIRYKLDESNYTASVYIKLDKNGENTYSGDIQVPSKIKLKGHVFQVTGIERETFRDCYDLTNITLPNSITRIGEEAFQRCRKLKSIILPDNIKEIGIGIFDGCANLTEIKVSVANLSFCTLDGVLFSKDTSTLICYPAKKDGEIYQIPNCVTRIADCAFSCSNLTSIIFPPKIADIGKYAFALCKGLTSITIPESVKHIGFAAFDYCDNLTRVILDANAIVSQDYKPLMTLNVIFGSQVQEYIIGKHVTSIGDYAFENCQQMTSVTIGDNVVSIGYKAFYGCSNLISVTIPEGVKTINKGATFQQCTALKKVQWNARDCTLNLYDSGNYMPPFSGSTSIIEFFFGESVKVIPNCLCFNIKNITSIMLPESVIKIGQSAFRDCSALKSITIPNSVVSIGCSAFKGSGLTSITIPSSIKSLARCTFDGCSQIKEINYPIGLDVSTLDIPATVKMIAYETPASPIVPALRMPLLSIVDGSVSIQDGKHGEHFGAIIVYGNENSLGDAEKKHIHFQVQNRGGMDAKNCEVITNAHNLTTTFTSRQVIPTIYSGETTDIYVNFEMGSDAVYSETSFTIEVKEPNGWGTAPFEIRLAPKKFEPPYLQVVDYSIASESGAITKTTSFSLAFILQNTKYGDAQKVKVKINYPKENVFLIKGQDEYEFPTIKSGESIPFELSMIASNNYMGETIPIAIEIQERYGKYAENKQLDLAINQVVRKSFHINKNEENKERKEIEWATMTSDVDRNIPLSLDQNNNTLVLILANENYQYMPIVPYAINDGNVFKEYCIKTLGIPNDNIIYSSDATKNAIHLALNDLHSIVSARENAGYSTNIIIYYTGHGVPDVKNDDAAYLMPVDGSDRDVTTGYKLDLLYQQLGQLPAKSIIVFLDACFSGVNRNDEALAQHKSGRLAAREGILSGNVVVFAASKGNQTAFVNDKEKHGLFTYCLLKKIQENQGEVSLYELSDYLKKEVYLKASMMRKEQTPNVFASPQVEDQWQNWNLK